MAAPGLPALEHRSVFPAIRCPVLAIQGREDQYGTIAQVDAIAAKVAGPGARS